VAAHQVRQIRTEAPRSVRACDCMAVHARGRFEDALSGDFLLVRIRGLLLCADPCFEGFGTFDRNPQQHFRVLRAAVLSALPEKDARLVRVQPHLVDAIWNEVCFSRKLRNPKAVISVGGEQFQECGRRMSGIADGNMQLVRCNDAERRVSKLPPELVTDDGDFQSRGGFRSVLDRVNYSGGSQKQDDYDQNRNDGPGQLDLRTPVYLGRLALRIAAVLRNFTTAYVNSTATREKLEQ